MLDLFPPPTAVWQDLVYTSNKREGEPGFAFPEGCPKGRCERSEQARGTSRGEGKPRLSRPLVGGISFFFILSYLFTSQKSQNVIEASYWSKDFIPPQGRYDSVYFIPSLVTRGGMKSFDQWEASMIVWSSWDNSLLCNGDVLLGKARIFLC